MDPDELAQLWDEALALNFAARANMPIDQHEAGIALDMQRDLLERMRTESTWQR